MEYKTAGGFAAFAEADITEAQTVGADAEGKTFVWWVKAEEAYGKTISIKDADAPDKTAVTLTVNITSNIPATAADYTELVAKLATSATTVTLTGNVTIASGQTLTIPAGKTVVIDEGYRLTTAAADALLAGAGTLENDGILDLASFDCIEGAVGNGGTIKSCARSSILIQDENSGQLIGDTSFNVTAGYVTLTEYTSLGAGTLLTLPAGSAATIKGAFMDASGEAYRIAKLDKFLVGGALTVDCDTNVSGTLEISAGGTLTINTGKMLSLVEVKADPVTYHGVLTNHGTVTNNGTIGVAQRAVIDGTVGGTIVHAAAIEATPIMIGMPNPSTSVDIVMDTDTFADEAADTTNWIINTGTTGLTVVNPIAVHTGNASVTIDFTGTAAAGTITIKADTGAMTSGVTSTTYELTTTAAASTDAGLTSVAGETDATPGAQTGADAPNAIAWEIDVG